MDILSTPAWKKRARQELHAKNKVEKKYNKLLASIKATVKESKDYEPMQTYQRTTKTYPSLTTSDSMRGVAAKKDANVYSGDYITGIATMHKSNLVPVGRGCDPEIYAKMRR